jgi:hypothetical protein
LFVPFNFIRAFFRVRELSFGHQARGRRRAKKKESEKVEFLPSEVSDPEISADLHLYLAFELSLSACCVAP